MPPSRRRRTLGQSVSRGVLSLTVPAEGGRPAGLMAIFRHTKDLPAAARGAVVVIGNFDGVHRGHQLLLADALRQADALGAPLAVLTFEPHPRRSEEPTSELQ